ncbi:unnamed protein product [Timema podura]|uniref:Uncharacterized protein n=1 Tax=Timema podura TaxID=61482 RepID=A0ABN7P776_TIMPD|nr:unnamed protein product [Timema podura]
MCVEEFTLDSSLSRESNLSTNRGNNLLVKLLRYRFPEIIESEQFTLLHDYLSLDTQKQVVRVPGYRYRGPGLNPWRFQNFFVNQWVWNEIKLGLMRTNEEWLE